VHLQNEPYLIKPNTAKNNYADVNIREAEKLPTPRCFLFRVIASSVIRGDVKKKPKPEHKTEKYK